MRCNFKCGFCSYWKKSPDAPELSIADFKAGAGKLDEMGVSFISIAGGEPFMRADLPEIIKALSQRHLTVLITNGWLVSRKKAREVFKSGLTGVSVSIDFPDAKSHDSQRGVEGAFERAVRALEFFTEERTEPYQRVNLFCVLNRRNIEHIEELILLADGLGVSFMLQPYCPMKNNDASFKLDSKTSARLWALQRKYPNFRSNPEYLRRIDEYIAGGVPSCRAGKSFLNIDSYGNISKCVEAERNIGNIQSLTAGDIAKRLRTEHAKNKCQACWYNCRGEIESMHTIRGLAGALSWLKP